MKTILVVAAALGLSAPMAFADCAGHPVNASMDVDKTITTASVVTEKQSRLPKTTDEIILEQQDVPQAE
jgi:hypothetical protein